MTPPTFRLALIQLAVTADKSQNLLRAAAKIRQAAAAGARLVVLPECFNSPYGTQHFAAYAEPVVGGESCRVLANAARENNVYLVGGSIPERDGERLYNTSTVFDPRGVMIAKHRKVHLFDIDIPGKIRFQESETLSAGDHPTVFDTEFGRVGLGICYDMRFPALARLAADAGCFMMIYPGAFNMTTGPLHWELLARARAIDSQMYVAVCSPARATSTTDGYVAWGHSTVVDPMAVVQTTLGHEEGTAYAEVEVARVAEARAGIPVRQQQRPDVYTKASSLSERFAYNAHFKAVAVCQIHMGKRKGDSLNPVEAHRRKMKKKEAKKAMDKRAQSRAESAVKFGTGRLEAEVQKLKAQVEEGLDTTGAHKLRQAEGMLRVAQKARAKALGERKSGPRMVGQAEQAPDDNVALPRNPQRSIYFHPVLNPYGVPPPGMPYKERDDIESDERSSDVSDDLDASMSDGSSEYSSEDDNEQQVAIVLPEAPSIENSTSSPEPVEQDEAVSMRQSIPSMPEDAPPGDAFTVNDFPGLFNTAPLVHIIVSKAIASSSSPPLKADRPTDPVIRPPSTLIPITPSGSGLPPPPPGFATVYIRPIDSSTSSTAPTRLTPTALPPIPAPVPASVPQQQPRKRIAQLDPMTQHLPDAEQPVAQIPLPAPLPVVVPPPDQRTVIQAAPVMRDLRKESVAFVPATVLKRRQLLEDQAEMEAERMLLEQERLMRMEMAQAVEAESRRLRGETSAMASNTAVETIKPKPTGSVGLSMLINAAPDVDSEEEG